MTNITIRIDSVNTKHVRFTIFQDGANTGSLCMDREAGNNFVQALLNSDNVHATLYVLKNDLEVTLMRYKQRHMIEDNDDA